METISNILTLHQGRKIERVRKLRGLTQAQLGERLGGISKQAVSKIELSEEIDDSRLSEIAEALEVTFEGLKSFNEEKVLYNTINFYENSGVTANSINANVETVISNEIEKTFAFFEKQLAAVKEELKEAMSRAK
jgi:transcriptional regulator with XRE-family HTH domain